MKKIIIADMDNTLCKSCKPITKEIREEIERLVNIGYTFVVVGGSKIEHIHEQVAKFLKTPIHLLGTSGTSYNYWNGKNLIPEYSYSLNLKEKQKIIKVLEELCKKFNLIPLTSKEDQIQDRDTQITISILGRNASSKIKQNYDPNKSKRKIFVEYLKNKLSEFEIKIGGTSSIDITKKGQNKGWGIKNFCNRKKFKLEECIFYGDGIFPGGNDHSVIGVIDYIKVSSPQDTLKRFKKIK